MRNISHLFNHLLPGAHPQHESQAPSPVASPARVVLIQSRPVSPRAGATPAPKAAPKAQATAAETEALKRWRVKAQSESHAEAVAAVKTIMSGKSDFERFFQSAGRAERAAPERPSLAGQILAAGRRGRSEAPDTSPLIAPPPQVSQRVTAAQIIAAGKLRRNEA